MCRRPTTNSPTVATATARLTVGRGVTVTQKKWESRRKLRQEVLGEAGIGYESLPELGNLFLDYADWQDRYRQLLEQAGELLVTRLLEIPSPLCLLCAEKKAEDCHRTKIAEYLAQTRNAEVQHIE